jgi:hypothetical protein
MCLAMVSHYHQWTAHVTQHTKNIDTMAAGPHRIIAVSYKYLYIHGTYAAQTWAYTACGSAHHST